MKKIPMKNVVLITMLCLAACTSVPLSTMWKMRSMGPEALISTPPEYVRAAVMSESWFLDKEELNQGKLSFTFTEPDEGPVYEYEFTMLDVTRPELLYLDTPPESQRWRVYAIDPEQLESFQSMQRQIDGWYQDHELKGWTMEMAYIIGNEGQDDVENNSTNTDEDSEVTARIPFRIDLRLIPEEGYFTLIRSTRLNFYGNRESADEP